MKILLLERACEPSGDYFAKQHGNSWCAGPVISLESCKKAVKSKISRLFDVTSQHYRCRVARQSGAKNCHRRNSFPPLNDINGVEARSAGPKTKEKATTFVVAFSLVDLKGIEPSNLTDANRALSQLSYRPMSLETGTIVLYHIFSSCKEFFPHVFGFLPSAARSPLPCRFVKHIGQRTLREITS